MLHPGAGLFFGNEIQKGGVDGRSPLTFFFLLPLFPLLLVCPAAVPLVSRVLSRSCPARVPLRLKLVVIANGYEQLPCPGLRINHVPLF